MTPVKQHKPINVSVSNQECQTSLDGNQFLAKYGKGKGFSGISQAKEHIVKNP